MSPNGGRGKAKIREERRNRNREMWNANQVSSLKFHSFAFYPVCKVIDLVSV